MNTNKLKASALLYAVVMTAIFSMMGSAILMGGYSQQMLLAISERPQTLYRNALSGINIGMELQPGESITSDLYGEGRDSVEILSKRWGAFTLLHATGIQHGETLQLIGLAGENGNDRTGLCIMNSDRPLSVCGKTIIKGDCYISKAGIKRAYIEGKSFEGNRLVNGNVYDNKLFPQKNHFEKTHNDILSFLENRNSISDSVITLDNLEPGDSLLNSFENKTIVVYSSSLHLRDITLKGNIILIAKDSITVSPTALLEDVILYARKINFREKCINTIQAFASDTILAGNHCTFNYPSVISLLNKQQNKSNPLISVQADCNITGDLLSPGNYSNRITSSIQVGSNCRITGNIYSSGSVDIKGILHGSLYCSTIILKTPSSFYENHLLDTEIDVYKRPLHYTGAICMSDANNKKIIKWMK